MAFTYIVKENAQLHEVFYYRTGVGAYPVPVTPSLTTVLSQTWGSVKAWRYQTGTAQIRRRESTKILFHFSLRQ